MTTYSDHQIYSSYLEQSQLTQVHRWFALAGHQRCDAMTMSDLVSDSYCLVFEGSQVGEQASEIGDQADVLVSQLRSLKLKGAVFNAVHFSPSGDVGETVWVRCEMRANESKGSNDSQYLTAKFEFQSGEALLPLIKRVSIEKGHAPELFADQPKSQAYTLTPLASRILSVNHRWHTLVESPVKEPPLFKEFLAPDFVMEFGYGAVRSYQELQDWLLGSASSVTGARHDLERFTWTEHKGGTAEAEFVLDWLGFDQQGTRMMAKTKHNWQLTDVNSNSRFPKIQHINVEFIKPFSQA